jgi:hypothetical protein
MALSEQLLFRTIRKLSTSPVGVIFVIATDQKSAIEGYVAACSTIVLLQYTINMNITIKLTQI